MATPHAIERGQAWRLAVAVATALSNISGVSQSGS